jgi:hypothetical protein
MATIKARFDGSVFVPDEPVDLPVRYILEIPIAALPKDNGAKPTLAGLVEVLKQFPVNPDWPADGAEQPDHYLYGTPKRP